MTQGTREPSRRALITGAGAAVAASVAGAAAVAAAPDADAKDHSGLACGPPGSTVAEFRGRLTQSGSNGDRFDAYGFLTQLRGAATADLFTGPATTVATALFTLVAHGELTARVLDLSVHALDIAGELIVYDRGQPGADFADPASFAVGGAVATFALTLQDVLTVFAPASGLPTLTGDMRQQTAHKIHEGQRFGARQQQLRLFATGLGFLTDPVTLNARLEIAGNWTAV